MIVVHITFRSDSALSRSSTQEIAKEATERDRKQDRFEHWLATQVGRYEIISVLKHSDANLYRNLVPTGSKDRSEHWLADPCWLYRNLVLAGSKDRSEYC